MNGLEIIKAVRKEYDVIDSFTYSPEVKSFLQSTLHHAIVDLLNEIDIVADEEFSKSEDLIHAAIAKSFNVYACFLYFSLTDRHKILKSIPHVEGDELVFIYNEMVRIFKFMSKKEIRKYAIKALDETIAEYLIVN